MLIQAMLAAGLAGAEGVNSPAAVHSFAWQINQMRDARLLRGPLRRHLVLYLAAEVCG